jgi:flagellar biosynthesis chaperone FliJ
MVNDYYDGRVPVEVTDMFLHQLDSAIEHDNRTIGNQQMQTAVLRWAVERRASLQSLLLADSLIECMERQLEQMKRERPSAAPDSFRAIRQVNAEREGK